MNKINQISVDGVVYDIATKKEVELEAKIDNKADKATTLDGYGITDAYTKDNIDSKLAQKNDILTFDTTPTADSTNPVTSGGVKTELDKKVDKEDGKGLSTNDYTTAEKSKVANLPDDTNTELSKKADKSVFFVGGFEGGLNASVESGGGAIGKNSKATSGGAIGENAKTTSGGSVGANSNSDTGGAIGTGAQTSSGFAGGYNAKTVNASGSRIDAVQLGTGTNSEEKTAQFYDYKIMKSDGNIPVERLTELKKLSIPHTTVSGYPVSVSDHLEGESVIDYKVYGNSVQDGTPAPDNPIEIQSVGDLVTDTSSPYYGKYDVPVTVCGKNLFDISKIQNITQTSTQEIIQNNDGTLTVRGTAVNTKKTLRELCPSLKVGDEAILSFRLVNSADDTKNKGYIYISIVNSTWISGTVKVITDEILDGLVYLYCRYAPQSDTITTGTISEFQVELGSTATPYEPYKGETKHIYLDEPLRKVGNYADYVDWGNQVVVRNILKFTLNGDLQGEKSTNSTDEYSYWYITNYRFSNMGTKQQSGMLCNMLPFNARININLYMSIGFGGNLDLLYICLPTSMATTLSEVSTILNGAICYMPLTTPTTEPITAPDFTVPNSEVMNISSGTVIPPSSMDVTYYQDINKVITNTYTIEEVNSAISDAINNYDTEVMVLLGGD